VILSTAAFLSSIGFAAFVLGHIFDYQGIAAIGGILILGVGAAAMVDGLETQSGEVEEQLDNSTTRTDYEYQSIGVTTSFPLGLVVTLLGAAMTGRVLTPQQNL